MDQVINSGIGVVVVFVAFILDVVGRSVVSEVVGVDTVVYGLFDVGFFVCVFVGLAFVNDVDDGSVVWAIADAVECVTPKGKRLILDTASQMSEKLHLYIFAQTNG